MSVATKLILNGRHFRMAMPVIINAINAEIDTNFMAEMASVFGAKNDDNQDSYFRANREVRLKRLIRTFDGSFSIDSEGNPQTIGYLRFGLASDDASRKTNIDGHAFITSARAMSVFHGVTDGYNEHRDALEQTETDDLMILSLAHKEESLFIMSIVRDALVAHGIGCVYVACDSDGSPATVHLAA